MSVLVPPGGTLGILGGGQLGRMLAMAAARLGIICHVYCPDPDSPAFQVAGRFTCAAYDDEAALTRFAAEVDAVTYEFENIPAASAALLARLKPLAPSAAALDITGDRLSEKTFLRSLGIGTAAFRAVDSLEDLRAALDATGSPAVLKTRRLGYDGKGQAAIRTKADLHLAFAAMNGQPAILEAFVPFVKEVSVIAARGRDGRIAVYDLIENEHRNHILFQSQVPARVAEGIQAQAEAIAGKIMTGLDYVGVLAVEMFVTKDGDVLVNEIAPRVHNSGHWTLEACLVSQFENHIRAVCGWPLGAPGRHSDAVMQNLIGEEADDWLRLAGEVGAVLHLYGKRAARAGRKMGHVTRLISRGGMSRAP